MKNRDIDKLNLSNEHKAEVRRLRNRRRNCGLTRAETDRYWELLKNGR